MAWIFVLNITSTGYIPNMKKKKKKNERNPPNWQTKNKHRRSETKKKSTEIFDIYRTLLPRNVLLWIEDSLEKIIFDTEQLFLKS